MTVIAEAATPSTHVFMLQVRSLNALSEISSLLLIHHLPFVLHFVNTHSECYLRQRDATAQDVLGGFVAKIFSVYTEMRDINKAFASILDATSVASLALLYTGSVVEKALSALTALILPLQLASILGLLSQYALKDE